MALPLFFPPGKRFRAQRQCFGFVWLLIGHEDSSSGMRKRLYSAAYRYKSKIGSARTIASGLARQLICNRATTNRCAGVALLAIHTRNGTLWDSRYKSSFIQAETNRLPTSITPAMMDDPAHQCCTSYWDERMPASCTSALSGVRGTNSKQRRGLPTSVARTAGAFRNNSSLALLILIITRDVLKLRSQVPA